MNLTVEPSSNNLHSFTLSFFSAYTNQRTSCKYKKCEFVFLFGNRCAREEANQKRFWEKKKKLKFRRLRFERVSEAHSYIRLYASRNSRLWHRHAHRYRNFYVRTFSCNNKVYLLPRRNNTIIQTVFPKFGKAYRIFFGWLDIKWLEDTRERKKGEREREKGGRENSTVKSRKISIFDIVKYQLAMWISCYMEQKWNLENMSIRIIIIINLNFL